MLSPTRSALSYLAVLCLLLSGCSTGRKELDLQSIPPSVSKIADEVVLAEDEVDPKSVKEAIEKEYDLKVKVSILDKAARGDKEKQMRKAFLNKVCGKNHAEGFVEVVLITEDYLEKTPLAKVIEGRRKALVLASTGDGESIYESYPEDLIDDYNRAVEDKKDQSALFQTSCESAQTSLLPQPDVEKPPTIEAPSQ